MRARAFALAGVGMVLVAAGCRATATLPSFSDLAGTGDMAHGPVDLREPDLGRADLVSTGGDLSMQSNDMAAPSGEMAAGSGDMAAASGDMAVRDGAVSDLRPGDAGVPDAAPPDQAKPQPDLAGPVDFANADLTSLSFLGNTKAYQSGTNNMV